MPGFTLQSENARTFVVFIWLARQPLKGASVCFFQPPKGVKNAQPIDFQTIKPTSPPLSIGLAEEKEAPVQESSRTSGLDMSKAGTAPKSALPHFRPEKA